MTILILSTNRDRVLYSMFHRRRFEEHVNAGNAGGGVLTRYRSAALVFKPAANSEW